MRHPAQKEAGADHCPFRPEGLVHLCFPPGEEAVRMERTDVRGRRLFSMGHSRRGWLEGRNLCILQQVAQDRAGRAAQ